MRISVLLFLALIVTSARAQEIPCQDLKIPGNDQQRYFLIGAKEGATAPEKSFGLLLVLPGGNGSDQFNPFVKNIWANALPDGFLVAQLVAVPSDKPNQIVWPTAKDNEPKQKFKTEAFIEAVVKDVKSKHKIDPERVYALAWSSGGPAVYASILGKDSSLRGAFVAMSVFMPARLPALTGAKEKRFFLYQSPEDVVTRYNFAKTAKTQLEKAGAKVELKDYAGGHGWHGDIFGSIRGGIEWLEKR